MKYLIFEYDLPEDRIAKKPTVRSVVRLSLSPLIEILEPLQIKKYPDITSAIEPR